MDSRLVGGRYQIERRIGQGGIADIYLAFDRITEQPVALKMARINDPAGAEAVNNEFNYLATHPHPAIISSLALASSGGLPAMVMPLLEQPEKYGLDNFVGKLGDSGLEGIAVSALMAEILECTAFIHFGGYVYNDFKPSNFILRRQSPGGSPALQPLLLDFNLVSRIGELPSKRGTLEYTAPEILRGRAPTPAADLYSIGITFFELFTGSTPFSSCHDSNLIREITETGEIDFSDVPAEFRRGLGRMLSRQEQARPQSAADAAGILGLESQFMELVRERIGHYFSSGDIPFAQDLVKAASNYIPDKPQRIFAIKGMKINSMDLNFLMAALALQGHHVERLTGQFSDRAIDNLLEFMFEAAADDRDSRPVLLVDDIDRLNPTQQQRLRALIRAPRTLPVITSVLRWSDCNMSNCCRYFDCLSGHTPLNAARITVSAYLKRAEPTLEWPLIDDATGGDPELIYGHLREAARSGQFNPFSTGEEGAWPREKLSLSAVAEANGRMFSSAGKSRQEVLLSISAWGNSVPLVLLTELDDTARESLDELIASGHLKREKDALSFPSGDNRRYLYSLLAYDRKRQIHRFWAEAAEKNLAGSDEFIEIVAYHWGESDNPVKGYNANLAAARDLFARGQLARASSFAEKLIALANEGGGELLSALMLYADIMKQSGEHQIARKHYVDLLCLLNRHNDPPLKAETFKDLGDLNRSLKRPRKALYYTSLALRHFQELSNEQGVANCHNNIGLIYWVNQEFDEALASFSSAYSINRDLGNFLELAKIESNIGIIKDIQGKTSEVAGHFETALANARRASDPWLEAIIGNNLGYFFIRQNNLLRARQFLEDAASISERIGYTESLINCQTNLGLCFLRGGELFKAIEYNQRAVQMAESLGNRHLAADSQLYLAEICIQMGNFALANDVLESLEADRIYAENDNLRNRVKLLRSDFHRSLQQPDQAELLAEEVLRFSEKVGDSRLRLDSLLCRNLAYLNQNPEKALQDFAEISIESEKFGHLDITQLAGLGMAKGYFLKRDRVNFAAWLEKILSDSTLSMKVMLEARGLEGELMVLEHKFDQAIAILSDVETRAAGNGFMPVSLEAGIRLAEIYLLCGKYSKARDVSHRAWTYANRIIASLPVKWPSRLYTDSALFTRLANLKDASADKEYMRI